MSARASLRCLVKLLACEIEQRRGEQNEHAQAEEVVGGPGAEKFGTKRKQIGAPGQAQHGSKPTRDMRWDFRVLEQIDDDAEQAKDSAGGDQAAGIERAGAGFAFVFLLSGGV